MEFASNDAFSNFNIEASKVMESDNKIDKKESNPEMLGTIFSALQKK